MSAAVDAPRGEVTVILPLFPSDGAKGTDVTLCLGLRCIDSFEDKPVGASWEGSPTDPEAGWDLTTYEQPLLSVTIPRP